MRKCIVWFAAFTALSFASARPAFSQSGDELRRYLAAKQGFDAAWNAAMKSGRVLRRSDPEISSHFSILINESGNFGTPAFPATHETLASNLCAIPVSTAIGYSLAKIEGRLKPGMDAATIARIKTEYQNENGVRHQNEIIPLIGFSLRCNALHVPLVTAFVAGLSRESLDEARRQGLRLLRSGYVELVMNVIALLVDDKVSDDNKRLLSTALGRDASAFAPFLTLSERRKSRAKLQEFRQGAPRAYQESLDAASSALNVETCEGICRL